MMFSNFIKKKQNLSKEKGALFFDIDGVLNTSSQWRNERFALSEELVKNLANYTIKENFNLIMTSSWRTGFYETNSKKNLPHINKLEKMLSKYGVSVAGATPVMRGHGRDEEIEAYLKYHPYGRVVALDDDPEEYREIPDYLFVCNSSEGFSEESIKKIKGKVKPADTDRETEIVDRD